MTAAGKPPDNWEVRRELEKLPDNLVGEVIGGALYTMGRPRPAHARIERAIGADLGDGRLGGPPPPAGWEILPEVEILFPTGESAVPDLSGWRLDRVAGDALEENPRPLGRSRSRAPAWTSTDAVRGHDRVHRLDQRHEERGPGLVVHVQRLQGKAGALDDRVGHRFDLAAPTLSEPFCPHNGQTTALKLVPMSTPKTPKSTPTKSSTSKSPTPPKKPSAPKGKAPKPTPRKPTPKAAPQQTGSHGRYRIQADQPDDSRVPVGERRRPERGHRAGRGPVWPAAAPQLRGQRGVEPVAPAAA